MDTKHDASTAIRQKAYGAISGNNVELNIIAQIGFWGPESKDEIAGSSSALRIGSRAAVVNSKKEKIGNENFFYLLTPAVMGDPFMAENPFIDDPFI